LQKRSVFNIASKADLLASLAKASKSDKKAVADLPEIRLAETKLDAKGRRFI
jgi:hypothetical protein